jgi:hypothetical protein
LHDWTSHSADAFRYLAMGLDSRTKASTPKLVIPSFGAV